MHQLSTRPDTSWPDMTGIHAATGAGFLAELASLDLIAGRERMEGGGPSR